MLWFSSGQKLQFFFFFFFLAYPFSTVAYTARLFVCLSLSDTETHTATTLANK